MNLFDYTLESLREFITDMGMDAYRAEQLFNWVYVRNIINPDEMTDLPKSFREVLAGDFIEMPLKCDSISQAKGSLTKILFDAPDTHIESVAIPSEDRTTFCISTQAGCPLGCLFCETGSMGLVRNLTASEIVSQVLLLQKETHRPDNIVLMGMGEALLNYDAVHKFLEIISEPKGYALSERRITLSTAGLLDKLIKFHKHHPKVEIAISLNAADNRTRKTLMPNPRLASFSEIIAVIPDFDCNVTLEYVLLDGVNDTEKDAIRLSGKLKKMPNVMVNLIPYNQTSATFKPPKWDSVHTFQNTLRASKIQCFIRKSRGSEIMAACGQLATRKSRAEFE